MYIFSSGSCAFSSKQFVSYDIKTPKVYAHVLSGSSRVDNESARTCGQ